MKKGVLIALIIAALVVIGFFINQTITGEVVYKANYDIPVTIEGIPATFTWNDKLRDEQCREVGDSGFDIYNKGSVTYALRYRMHGYTQKEHCKDSTTLVEFVCGADMPGHQSLYDPPSFMLWIKNKEVYSFEFICANGCSAGACK